MIRTTSFLAFALAVNLIAGACLDTTTLKDIGFDNTQTLAIVPAPVVCTDLFKTSGTCVPEADVQAKITADNKNLQSSVEIFSSLSTAMNKLADTVGSSSASDKAAVNGILTRLSASKDGCITAWSTVQQGITCLLASGDASTYTTVSTTVDVNVDTIIIGSYLTACMDYIDLVCLLTAGVSVSTSVSVTDSIFLTNESEYKSSCTILNTNYSCSTDACNTAKYNAIVNVFFKPYNYEFFPNSNIFTNITNKLKDLADQVSTWFKDLFSRRLLEDNDVNTRSSPSGADVKTYGTNSGQTKVTNNAYLVSVVVAFVMNALIA